MKLLSRNLKLTATLLSLAFVGASLAGCSTSKPTNKSPENSPSFSSNAEYQLAFAECMRGKGIDMPDPGKGGQISAGSGDHYLESAKACQVDLGAPPAGPDGKGIPSDAEQHEIFLKVAQCFRDNGIDVPDPAAGESLSLPMDADQGVLKKCATAGKSVTQ
ncbi:hypothetical protein ACVXZ4_13200 [Lacisediminihabitans sp. FW035]